MKKYNECTSGKFIREAMNEINKAPLGTCPASCSVFEKLARQLFRDRSNCYADVEDDEVVQAIDEDQFIKILDELF